MTVIDPKFTGRVITVNVEHVLLPNGREAALEIVPTLNRLGFEIRSLIRNG